jgi:ubiquinone/menaquinone biosynthesis C-methylase UbiE
MDKPISTIQADFDRIALLSNESWDHNTHYHNFLLQHVPANCREALEIGCGTGSFSRLLAKCSNHVLALDLSPQMVRIAKERSTQFSNIDFQVADVTSREMPTEQFDCIATIATLHHLPMTEMLLKMKNALRVNGVLMVLDLFKSEGFSDTITSALAMPVNLGLKLIRPGQLIAPREVREAWKEHGRHDVYPSLAQVRQVCEEILPGAKIRKHLLWRYSIIWKKT